ncbi:hypothetical protein [Treponema zioleckii]|uniref:hypothetical protein n=1 Tax=Treponema zioleckii TaxID=331680 RepID=UPI00168A8DA6|nr:hypothetical protein [Treponema zioleckii]
MDNEEIKQKLLQIEDTQLDFTVTMTGKESTRVNGLYKPDTHEILLHNKNFKSDSQLIYTAIHEYTHHLETEKYLEETGGKLPMKGAKVHTAAFWARFHELLQKAEEMGIYKISIDDSPELKELTEKIRKDYMEVNGKLMQEFGKLLVKAHELCEQANIRYEDYLDRVLCLPRNTAKDLTRVAAVPVNPALGFDNMKKVATLKKPEDRDSASQKILAGKSPDTVTELMKKKASGDDPKTKLEKEKNRLEKTIEALQQRLQYVEESLENL